MVNERPAVMENVLEHSTKTNHTGNFSVLQYYLKKKAQKWNKGWSYILLLSKTLDWPLPIPVV